MKKSHFQITQAVLNAYLFVGREWRYLATLAVMPVLANFITQMAVNYLRPEASFIEGFLWSIPATIISAWFMFAEVRLLVLGEKITHLPRDTAFAEERRHLMQGSVISWLLFNMFFVAIFFLISLTRQDAEGEGSTLLVMACMILIGGGIWAVRFSVAHLLLAIGYPVKKFIHQVDGPGISFRLLGMGLMASLPLVALLQTVISPVLPSEPRNFTGFEFTFIAAAGSVVSLVLTAVLTAAASFALRDILNPKKTGTRT